MFLRFFYLLRDSGLKVSLDEWLMLMQGLRMGLHGATMSGFYTLCRAVVVTSETDFDRFDQAFVSFFKDAAVGEDIPEQLQKWLDSPELSPAEAERLAKFTDLTVEEIEKLFAQRLADQDAEHNGGRKRDWRGDSTLDSRQFQAAFRSLCQVSRDTAQPKTELDLDATVQATCRQGGRLHMEYTYPRRNMLRLLLLIDSGGSMERHQRLCSLLFQSISKAGHFKDLKIYYFHNCVGNVLYEEPTLDYRRTVPTGQVLRSVGPEYRVIIVGDGEMAPEELVQRKRWRSQFEDAASPLDWLMKIKGRYPHVIWLHPQPVPQGNSYWTQTFRILEEHFDMYRLSLDSLTQGMKKLMQNR